MKIVRYVDRPELLERRQAGALGCDVSRLHARERARQQVLGTLLLRLPGVPVALVEGDELLAEAHAVPVPWDSSLDDLPSGWEEGFVRGMTSAEPATALMAIAISVEPTRQGQRLSSRMIESFKANAVASGLGSVIAPVRPTLKEHSAHPDRALRRLASLRRLALRSLDQDPRGGGEIRARPHPSR